MTDGSIPNDDRELIQLAIRNALPKFRPEPRWQLVKRLFGTDRTMSETICTRYGFDPDKLIAPPRRVRNV